MAPTLARWGNAEHGLASAILRGEHDAARRGGWFLATEPPSAGETSSWLEFTFHVVVVAGANEAPVLRRLGEGWPRLPFLLDAVRNSSVESSIMALCGVDAPL
jgi:hypothetical protein